MPANAPVSFALLPKVDHDDLPDQRPDGGFAGGLISAIAPFLAPGAITTADDLLVVLRLLPASRNAIRDRLRGDAGLHWAPGALFSRAAWEDE